MKGLCVAVIGLAALSSLASAESVREIHVLTADCTDCGMTALGHLSAKVIIASRVPRSTL